MSYFFIVIGSIGYILALLMCWQESRQREINFLVAILFCVFFTPLFGYFFISLFPKRNRRGCKWCGNKKNEAEFCGICYKNEEGLLRSK